MAFCLLINPFGAILYRDLGSDPRFKVMHSTPVAVGAIVKSDCVSNCSPRFEELRTVKNHFLALFCVDVY